LLIDFDKVDRVGLRGVEGVKSLSSSTDGGGRSSSDESELIRVEVE